MTTFLLRFLKVMSFTAVLALLGPVLIVAGLYVVTPEMRVREDLTFEEHVLPLTRALAAWFGVMLFIGFIMVMVGLPKSFEIPFAEREAFAARLREAACGVRYRFKSQDGDRLTFKPSIVAGVLAEKIHVTLGQNNVATVSAPRTVAGKLERLLRQP